MTTTPAETSAPADLRLGRDVVRRMRLPGPPLGRPLPSRIGSLASSVSRFAAATSRPVDVRRALIGPGPGGLAGSSAPPRWWTPVASSAADSAVPPDEPAAGQVRRTPASSGSPATAAATATAPAWLTPARPVAIRRLPERGLPRAAREVPDESNRTPGGILGGLRGEVARVRRLEEVVAVGPMLTQTDRAKLNAGLASRSAQQAAAHQANAHQATSQPTVARRATTRTPRQPASAAPAPSASEPPDSGGSSTVSVVESVEPAPPVGSVSGTASAGDASATVSAAGSVAQAPPAHAATPIRRVARPSWQLRSQYARFDGLVGRTPNGGGPGSPAGPTAPASVGLSSVVSRLATPDRLRPMTASTGSATSLESSVRGPEIVAAAGPGLIADSMDAPATVRRHAWSAGSLVMRQAAGARAEAGVLAASRPTAPTAPATPTAPAALAAPSSVPSASTEAAAPGTAPTPADSTSAGTTTATAIGVPPAARSSEPVVRRLPSSVGSSPDSSTSRSGAQATVPGHGTVADPPPTGPGTAAEADVRRLPRLWRRATDIRPATDVRSSIPAPVVRLASDPATSARAAASSPAPSPAVHRLPAASAPVASAPVASTPTAVAPAPTTPATPAAAGPLAPGSPVSTPAATVRRSTFPVSRVGAHVASPGIAGADVGMPELMTIRRATAHGTDAHRTLATGFGAPETIRPAGSPVTAPIAAVGGETRLWRRTVTPSGAARSCGAPAGATATRAAMVVAATAGQAGRAPATGATPPFAGSAPAARAGSPVRRTWQPWAETPGTAARAAPITSFPAGPPGAASAPTGRHPAADVRRMTVAPPRISVAPSQPPPPPVPAVGRTAAGNQQPAPPAAQRGSSTASNTGSSLVAATAHLFATPDAPLVRRAVQPGGSSMSSLSPSPASSSPPIRRLHGQSPDGGTMSDETLSAAATDSLVDQVVERIERRVIEELERRGRSYGRGGF